METMMKNTFRELLVVAALALVVFTPSLLVAQGARVGGPAGPSGLPDLVGGLKSTPGCLGVETAQTSSGKQVIFAWFENKKAALAWYYSDMHQGVMHSLTSGTSSGRKPLADVADNGGPILAIASITPRAPGTSAPQVDGVQLPVSQIAIELYSPLPGGVAIGGRFAPSTVKVPGLLEPATVR